jgi:hypothetical protein
MKRIILLFGLILLFSMLSCESDKILNPESSTSFKSQTTLQLPKASNSIIYLSEQGSDSNPGTITKPVKTLKKAIGLAAGVSDIYATWGTYTACRANLKTSLYGGYSLDFSHRDLACNTEIVGTGYWGDPLPVIQVIDAAHIIIDGVTIKAAESATFKPVAIYFQDCDSTVILQNSKIYGQLSGDAKGMSAIYINEASPKILNNEIYGGNLNVDIDAINGIKVVYSKSLIQGNSINAGKNQGCLHGIYSQYSKCRIIGNTIYGGESGESCYACAIRTGKAIESWDDSGSEDLIQNNELYGGIGSRTYAIIASQESRQMIKENLIDGGAGSIVSMGIYVKTNDKPSIIGNTFQNCRYGSYEWNFRDYAPGETSNCQSIRNNFYKSSVQIFVHWYYEIPEDTEHNVSNLTDLVQTQEGMRSLGYWGNRTE